MDFFREIIVNLLAKKEMLVAFPNLELSVAELVEMECYRALLQIKAIIDNDSLDDFDCVEKIVSVFEEIGSNGGSRHDFG